MSCILHTWVTWVLNIFVSWSQTQRTQRSKSRNPIDGPVYVFDKKQCHDMSEYLHDDPKHPKKHPWPGTIPVGYLLYLHLFTSKESTWINYQFGFTQHLWMIFPHFPAMVPATCVDYPSPVATSRPYWDAAAAPGTEVLASHMHRGCFERSACIYMVVSINNRGLHQFSNIPNLKIPFMVRTC